MGQLILSLSEFGFYLSGTVQLVLTSNPVVALAKYQLGCQKSRDTHTGACEIQVCSKVWLAEKVPDTYYNGNSPCISKLIIMASFEIEI